MQHLRPPHFIGATTGSSYLRVVQKGFLVVDAAPSALRRLPLSVDLYSVPSLLQSEEVCVHHAADGHVGEVLAIILHQHPTKKQRSN